MTSLSRLMAASAASDSPDSGLDTSAAIAERALPRASAIAACSASIWSSVSRVTPTCSRAGQAISCSPSWWSVSCLSKFSQATPSCRARSLSPALKVVSAPSKRSRSRRIAPWMTLFMLIVAMNRIVDPFADSVSLGSGLVQTGRSTATT